MNCCCTAWAGQIQDEKVDPIQATSGNSAPPLTKLSGGKKTSILEVSAGYNAWLRPCCCSRLALLLLLLLLLRGAVAPLRGAHELAGGILRGQSRRWRPTPWCS